MEQDKTPRQELIDKIIDVLDDNGITPENVGDVERVRVGSWQVVTKNAEGQAEVHDLSGIRMVYRPTNEAIEPISQVAPAIIKPVRLKTRKSKDRDIVILADSQHGFRQTADGYIATHDEQVCDVALQLAKYLQPSEVIHNGDALDAPTFGKFEIGAKEFRDTMQMGLDSLHEFFAKLRASIGEDALIVWLEGNHDARITKYVRKYAGELQGIKRACCAEEMGVLTLPYLLRLDELAVKYVGAYPAGRYMIADNLQALHGTTIRTSGKSASAIVNKEIISTEFAHNHRAERAERTYNDTSKRLIIPRIVFAESHGALCDISGNVPSVKSGVDFDGKPALNYENWQNGLGIVHVSKLGHIATEHISIDPVTKEAYYDGKIFKPNGVKK